MVVVSVSSFASFSSFHFELMKGNISIKFVVLAVLLLQNAMYTILRRYSVGVMKDTYSSNECLLLAEVFKMALSLAKIRDETRSDMPDFYLSTGGNSKSTYAAYIRSVLMNSGKMLVLAWIYAAMNLLSFVALRLIDASTFTVVAQLKILTTAVFSYLLLRRRFSLVKVLALFNLVLGAILVCSQSAQSGPNAPVSTSSSFSGKALGMLAVAIEVTLSGFASIYFEKVIKGGNNEKVMGVFERNVQLAFYSIPSYAVGIMLQGGGEVGYGGGWNARGVLLSLLGGGGGILVALSVKYADSILKSLATSGSIILATGIGWLWMDGPLNEGMVIGAAIVILAIFQYSTDGMKDNSSTTLTMLTPSSSPVKSSREGSPKEQEVEMSENRIEAREEMMTLLERDSV